MRPTLSRYRLGHLLGDSPRGRIWLATDGTRDVVLWELLGNVVQQLDADRRLEKLCAVWTGADDPWLSPSLEYGEQPIITQPYFASLPFDAVCRASRGEDVPLELALQPILALAESLARSPDLVESFGTLVTGATVRVGFDGTVRAGPDPLRALEAWDEGLRVDSMLPPEMFDRGVTSPAGAVWKLALFALYALESGDPFRDDPEPHLRRNPKLPRELKAQWPAALSTLLDAAMANQPGNRPALRELCDGLRAFTAPATDAATWRAELIRHARPEAERTQGLQLAALHERPLEPIPAELEAKLLENPDEPSAWLVIADWLESQAHPRGQLAALQRKQHLEPDEAMEALVERLVLRSDLAPQPGDEGPFEVEWGHHGWVEALRGLGAMDSWSIERVLRHPGLRYLRRVCVPAAQADPEAWVAALLSAQPPLLKRLEVSRILLHQRSRLTERFAGLEVTVRPPPPARPGRPPRINLGSPPPPPNVFTRFFERLRGR